MNHFVLHLFGFFEAFSYNAQSPCSAGNNQHRESAMSYTNARNCTPCGKQSVLLDGQLKSRTIKLCFCC